MRKLFLLMVGCIFISVQLLAQDRVITGSVRDDKGNPLLAATITVKGTRVGTTSKDDGSFTLTVPAASKFLEISAVGMATQQVSIENRTNLSVILVGEEKSLKEVIVVGYGTQKRADLTGAVATVKPQDIENKPFTSVDKALQGLVPGLQSVATSGAPGSNQQIRIRGISSITASSAPLWVIDGVPVNTGDVSRLTTSSNLLSTLNPNDIESITVLKDAASASIYGSRAANGVILVTTKKGRAGKTKFRLDAEAGQSDMAYFNDRYTPLNAAEYFTITREGLVNLGASNIDATLAGLGYNNGVDYNWLENTTRKGNQQQYNLSASGGDEKTTFYVSGGYFAQEGITIATDLERYTGAIRATNKATDKLTFNVNIDGGFVRQNTPLNGGAFGNPVLNSYFILPSRNAYKADGSYNIVTTDFPNGAVFNSIALANIDKRRLKELSLRGSVGAEYKIIENLRFKTSFGTDYNTLEEDQYNNPLYGDGWAADPTDASNPAGLRRPDPATSGRVFAYYTRYFNWVWTNTLDYHLDILKSGDLSTNVQVGYESQASKAYTTSTQARGLPLNFLLNVAAVGATPQTASSTFSDYSFMSTFSSINLNYKDRYVVSGSYRRDGSSRFGANNKYGNFWSVGGAWNVSNEDFMNNSRFINQLKLRASYGVNGNAGIGNYDWFPGYGFGNNYNLSPGSAPNNVGNLDLTWEQNKPFNVGIDLSVFSSRLNVSADYYIRKSTELLLGVPLSRTSGFATASRNIGELENKGIEFTINAIPVQVRDFSWIVDFNFANNKNRVTSLPDGKDIASGSFLIRQGYAVQTFFVREYKGADPANGDPLWYLDSTKKTTTNNYSSAQRVMFASASPKFFGSFTNSINFKGFRFEAQLYYNFGNYVQDPWAGYYLGAGFGATFNKVRRVLDRWQKAGDETDVPKYIANGNKSFQSFSTFYLAQGDFIRLRNMQLGYELPQKILARFKMERIFFYVRGTNLWTWVKDENLPFDPEQGVASQSNLEVFIPKTVTFGLNLAF